MKKITIVDQKKLDDYLEKTLPLDVNLDKLYEAIVNKSRNYEDIDIVNHLVNYLQSNLSNRKAVSNSKLGKYVLVVKMIIEKYNEKEEFIGSTIITKTKNLDVLYINNRSFIGKDGDGDLIDELLNLKSLIETNLSFKNPNKQKEYEELEKEEDLVEVITEVIDEKSAFEYESIISKLHVRIDDLETQVDELNKKLDDLNRESKKDVTKINNLNQKVDKYKIDLRKARSEIKRLELEKDKLDKELDKANSINKTIDEFAIKINELNNSINTLREEKDSLTKELKEKDNELKELRFSKVILDGVNDNKNRNDIIDDLILKQLFIRQKTVKELMDILNEKDLDVSKEEVLHSLKRISKDINVMPLVSLEKKYGITEPAVRIDQRLNIPGNYEELDMMFLADFHYYGYPDFLKAKLDHIYDYCAKNDIKQIITLGDVFDDKAFKSEKFKKPYKEAKELVESFDEVLPYDENIKNFILGGNHDRIILKYGFDPIEHLTLNREDVVSLGYDNAYLMFGGADIVGLHHMGVPREDVVSDIKESSEQTLAYLNRMYENANLNFTQQYFDLFGHFHSARFMSNDGYGVVPSLLKDRNSNGAWHIKFYLDNNGRIDYMVIKNLAFKNRNEGIKSTIEIPYQKIRKQKK